MNSYPQQTGPRIGPVPFGPGSVAMVATLICATVVPLAFASPVAGADERDLRELISNYSADLQSVTFRYDVEMSTRRRGRLIAFYEDYLTRLERTDWDELSQAGRIDYLLFRNKVTHELDLLRTEARNDLAIAELLPFAAALVELAEDHEEIRPVEGERVAEELQQIVAQVNRLSAELADANDFATDITSTQAIRASRRVDGLRRSMSRWHRFYDGYDPVFSWWTKAPYADMDQALTEYAATIRNRLAGINASRPDQIVGEPIGRNALLDELRFEMIPYSPEELIEIANAEFEWCDREMDRAAAEMGLDGDWRSAQEQVKRQHVTPGQQPALIRDLAVEAIDFLEQRDLVTIPPLCKEAWRMQMMSPDRQRVSPYFLGGETIIVSFPTDTMSHPDKLMSMRGNNVHFARATVHHELIPGHHLQGFMTKRHRAYRRPFATPFWLEGWALYWEMYLWDLDFAKSPEDRIGMLFWRKHRCARIIFSLGYHLERMTPQECIDFLVERVGHERNNATAEVRRSVMGGYGPLYQAAYMLGGLQIRALHRELVQSGQMTDRAFHDAILQANSIPIEMVRATLTNLPLTPNYESSWRFYDSAPIVD